MESFGEVLKRLRQERGLSQQELANRSGVKRSHIASIESSNPGTINKPQYATIVRLAEALGVFPVDLVAPTGEAIITRPDAKTDPDAREILALYGYLSPADRDRLVAIARALYQLSRE